MNRQQAIQLRHEITAAPTAVAARHDLTVELKHGRYDMHMFTVPVVMKEADRSEFKFGLTCFPSGFLSKGEGAEQSPRRSVMLL